MKSLLQLVFRFSVISLCLYLSACSQLHTQQFVGDDEPLAATHDVAGNNSETTANPDYEPNQEGNPKHRIDPNCVVTEDTWAAFPPVDYQNLWNRVRAGYKLSYADNNRIQKHLDWYARNPSYIDRVTERANRYLYSIVNKLEQRNMPMELALLPIVESAYDPFAYSPGRASGMWQFIPATGRRYGLVQNFWYDGRRDVEASTNAALDYLTDLHKRFDGDWLLALAAYNTGEGNVQRAIRRNRRAGKATDFWSLRLPRETRAYVPQLLAVSKIVADPDAYDVALHHIPNSAHYAIIDIESQLDLARAAELAEMEMQDLYYLNPGFNKWATNPNGPHHLLIPVDKAEAFAEKLAGFPRESRVQWQDYTIEPGDSLLKIANKFNTSVTALKQANGLRGNTIRAGKSLLIPTAAKADNHYAMSDEQRLQRVQSRGVEGAKKINYTVKPGDSFWEIARRYSVGVGELAKWNGMAPKDKLQIGQHLVVWAEPDQENVFTEVPQSMEMIKKVNYRVRNGDSLARIASKFNLTVNQIANWNSIKKNRYIHPGQLLTLWIDVTESY